jgi:hypothetical protein
MVVDHDATDGSLVGRVRVDPNDTLGTDCCLHRSGSDLILDPSAGTVKPSLKDVWALLN